MFLPRPRVKVSIVGSLRDREVACSASDRQGSNFESCVWRTVSSQSSHHPQEVLLAQFSLYVHKGGLKPDSFHFQHCMNVIGLQMFRAGKHHGYFETTFLFHAVWYRVCLSVPSRSCFGKENNSTWIAPPPPRELGGQTPPGRGGPYVNMNTCNINSPHLQTRDVDPMVV